MAADALPLDTADRMVENAVGTFALPFGVGLNFLVNGRDYVVPHGGRGAVGDRGGLERGAAWRAPAAASRPRPTPAR